MISNAEIYLNRFVLSEVKLILTLFYNDQFLSVYYSALSYKKLSWMSIFFDKMVSMMMFFQQDDPVESSAYKIPKEPSVCGTSSKSVLSWHTRLYSLLLGESPCGWRCSSRTRTTFPPSLEPPCYTRCMGSRPCRCIRPCTTLRRRWIPWQCCSAPDRPPSWAPRPPGCRC